MENVRISLQLNDVSLHTVIQQIESLTPFRFLAKAEDIEREAHISIQATNQPVSDILKQVLTGRNLQFRQSGTNILLTPKQSITATRTKFSLHGTVRSAKTGEAIIGATVSVVGETVATSSNEYGFYSLTLPAGKYMVQFSAIGSTTSQLTVELTQDVQLSPSLELESSELATVTVTGRANPSSRKSPQMSMERINVQSIRNIPVIFGERDILKTIQLLPGVKSAGEGSSGFYVLSISFFSNPIPLHLSSGCKHSQFFFSCHNAYFPLQQ